MEDLKQELADAAVHLDGMIRDSDLVVVTPSYGKRVPKKCKLSPDGWFQVRECGVCVCVCVCVCGGVGGVGGASGAGLCPLGP